MKKIPAKEQRISPRHGTFGEKIPPQHGTLGQKIPPQHGTFGERIQLQHGTFGERIPPQHGTLGERLLPQHGTLGEKIPPQHGTLDQNIPPQGEMYHGKHGTFDEMYHGKHGTFGERYQGKLGTFDEPTPALNRDTLLEELPDGLKKKIEKVGKRILKEDLNQIIIALCSMRPYNIEELTLLLGRNPKSFKNFNIKNLLETKRLFYWIPEMIRHPQQKYVADPSMARSNTKKLDNKDK